MYRFGITSKKRLSTCHGDLQLIMNEAIKISDVDFGIAEGYRTVERQQQLYRLRKSKIDGIIKKSKHNMKPSMAVDIFPVIKGLAKWDEEHLSYLSGIIHAVSERLYKSHRISHRVRWGGNWDMDGEILIDQSFDDRPHFELVKK